MIRCAIVDLDKKIVLNVVEYDQAPVNPPLGFEGNVIAVQDDRAAPGWHWDGTKTFDPVPPTPVPTEAQITDEAMNSMNPVTKRMLFNLESRVRALESKPAITKAQFTAAMKALP